MKQNSIYYHPEYRGDSRMVKAAVMENEKELQFASDELKGSKDFILELIEDGVNVLQFIPQWRSDKEVVLAAVRKYGTNLQYASDDLKKDIDIVKTAIQKEPFAARSLDKSFQNNEELALIAVSKYSDALQFFDKTITKNQKFVLQYLKLVTISDHLLDEISDELPIDWDFYQKVQDIYKTHRSWKINDFLDLLKVKIPDFTPTLIEIGELQKNNNQKVRDIVTLRQDEWFAKIEENALRCKLGF